MSTLKTNIFGVKKYVNKSHSILHSRLNFDWHCLHLPSFTMIWRSIISMLLRLLDCLTIYILPAAALNAAQQAGYCSPTYNMWFVRTLWKSGLQVVGSPEDARYWKLYLCLIYKPVQQCNVWLDCITSKHKSWFEGCIKN